ncbi:hypothetical protein Vadar_032949 [Vaccinium darrowii]|uniref:Uncharacterized protein n=1 Tax=Vaccinium darrowii TaxID=229202 RepID=A0ACB7X6A3_9ERIC|nr:hypothetical protein Vadar_032949 [Vaccinium darrowii]
MPQKKRNAILGEFRGGETRVLITSDVWARRLSFCCSYTLSSILCGPKANLSSDGVKSDNEVMDGDVICLDERTNGIEYDVEQDSNSNLLSAVGDYVTPLVVETWAMQAKDDTTASYMIGNGEGGLEDVTAKELLDEVAPVVK